MRLTQKVREIIFALFAGIVIILLLTINYFFFGTSRFPEGDCMIEEISPNGEYIVRTFEWRLVVRKYLYDWREQ